MKKRTIRPVLCLSLLLFATVVINAQTANLKVKDGVLYTIDGKWGEGYTKHYSVTSNGLKYNANVIVKQGNHVLEYFSLKEKKTYCIKFLVKPEKTYLVYCKNKKPVVKEDGAILSSASIVNVSSETGNDNYQVIPGISDKSNAAYFYWEAKDDYYNSWNYPVFELLKVDKFWGDGSGHYPGLFNNKKGFKVMLPLGEHTITAAMSFGGADVFTTEVVEFKYVFKANKTYAVVFDNFGVDKSNISSAQAMKILNSARIIEVE